MSWLRSYGAVLISVGLLSMHGLVANGAEVILNEYNAVGGSDQLDEGLGKDTYFGLIDGNGGNWFELLVIEDQVDMRGWSLEWTEDEAIDGSDETAAGVITLSSHDIWSNLRSGTIVTFIETADADGASGFNTSTDISYDPLNDDWWINVATQQEQAKGADGLVSTITNDGNPGDFSVGNDDWTLTVKDATGKILFGPVGEGADWAGGSVSGREGGSLEGPVADEGQMLTWDDWRAITPANEFYDDTGSTSFGAANADYDDIDEVFITVQDLSALRSSIHGGGGDPVPGDFNDDGLLTAVDINALTAAVGNPNADAQFDLNEDGNVNAEDRRVWVEDLKKTYFGDSNLDGEFGTGDFVAVFALGEYEDGIVGNSVWETGDWNGDGEFSTSDFVTAFEAGGFEQGPRGGVAAVPEPTGATLVFAALGTVVVVGRGVRLRSANRF